MRVKRQLPSDSTKLLDNKDTALPHAAVQQELATAQESRDQELAQQLVGEVSIKKLFPSHGYFTGLIQSYDPDEKLYTVRYVDEEEEQMSLEKLRPYILKTKHAHLLKMQTGKHPKGDRLKEVEAAEAEAVKAPALPAPTAPVTSFKSSDTASAAGSDQEEDEAPRKRRADGSKLRKRLIQLDSDSEPEASGEDRSDTRATASSASTRGHGSSSASKGKQAAAADAASSGAPFVAGEIFQNADQVAPAPPNR